MIGHVVPTRTYYMIFAALMALTLITVAVAFIDLGAWSTPIALAIASTKAILIVLYFMHIRYTPGLTKIVLVAGLLWLAILILGILDDYMTRGWLPIPGK